MANKKLLGYTDYWDLFHEIYDLRLNEYEELNALIPLFEDIQEDYKRNGELGQYKGKIDELTEYITSQGLFYEQEKFYSEFIAFGEDDFKELVRDVRGWSKFQLKALEKGSHEQDKCSRIRG